MGLLRADMTTTIAWGLVVLIGKLARSPEGMQAAIAPGRLLHTQEAVAKTS